MKISFSCKHSDMFNCVIVDEENNIMFEHDGYAPQIGSFSGGDYTGFVIDNETGKIENWKPITKEDIANVEV